MKLFVIVVMLFLVMGIMFADSDDSSRGNNSANVEKRMENSEKNRMENVREKMMNRSEMMQNMRERMKERCETSDDDDVKNKCTRALENISECKSDGVNTTMCKRNLIAEAAREMVRKRHDLNEQCRGMTAENRSSCERRINAIFKNETHAKFLQFVKNRVNKTSDELNESEREFIKEKHKEKMKEVREKLNSSVKEKLLDRLTNAIEQRENVAVRMDAFISKAKEKGHDTTDLEFLLQEYEDTLLSAKAYQENGQYKDAVGAVQEANKIFSEFKRTAAQLVKEHKENRRHKVNPETAFTDNEMNSTDG